MPTNPNRWRDFLPIRKIVAQSYPHTTHLRSNRFGGPDGKYVPFEVNRTEGWGDDNSAIPDYRFRYVRAGNLVFIDHNLMSKIPNDLLSQYSNSIIWLWRFQSVFCEPTHLQYSPLTIHALTTLDLRSKHVLDLGAADGILSLTAMKSGARRTTAVELHKEYFPYYANHQRLNQFDEERMTYLFGDLSEPDKIISEIESPTPDIAVANIGPWYKGDPHLSAIRLAAKIPTVKTFIAGAFIKDHPEKNPDDAIDLLKSLGFNANYRQLTFDGVCLAFMLDREG